MISMHGKNYRQVAASGAEWLTHGSDDGLLVALEGVE